MSSNFRESNIVIKAKPKITVLIINSLFLIVLLNIFVLMNKTLAADPKPDKSATVVKNKAYQLKNRKFTLRLVPRSPEQMSAFYYGRGFPAPMVEKIKQLCLVTVGLHNKSKDLIMLDFNNWTFRTKTGTIKRYPNKYWINKFHELKFPKPSIVTFRWTTLNDNYEFQPDEREGGNILLPRVAEPFSIQGTLHITKGTKKTAVPVKFENVVCPK